MNRKVTATIKEYAMIGRGDQVCAAVSGGADSVALLHALHRLSRGLGFTLTAMHLNHNLRGRESRRDELFVRELCRKLNIPLRVASVQVGRVAEKRRISVEECARAARYAFFGHCAGEAGKIATAHTASDNLETLLFNLARGTGRRGLRGIPPVRGNIIRPLIHCSRREVEEYCHKHKLAYVTDSTNLTDDYTRNRIRHQVVPVLREQNPRLEETVTRLTGILAQEEDYLEAQAAAALKEMGLGGPRFSRSRFLALSPALRPRVLRRLLVERGLRYDAARLQLLGDRIASGSGAVQLSPQVFLRCGKESFTLAAPRPESSPQAPSRVFLQLPGKEYGRTEAGLGNRRLRITLLDWGKYKKNVKIGEKQFKNLLDCDRIRGIAILRCRGPGDKIRLAGRGCTKAVRRLMNEEKIPPEQRDSLLLLADSDNRPLWLERFGPSEEVAVTPQTRYALLVEVRQAEEFLDAKRYTKGAH